MDSLTKGISQAVSGQTKKLDHLLNNSKTKDTKINPPKQRKRTKVKA
jgi:hypothetical protein